MHVIGENILEPQISLEKLTFAQGLQFPNGLGKKGGWETSTGKAETDIQEAN